MHKLSRQIRFCVNPFPVEAGDGDGNSYSARPGGEGLAIYLALWVELAGQLNGQTGFVINVTEIDRVVRKTVLPIFDRTIKEKFGAAESVSFESILKMLRESWGLLAGEFAPAGVSRLCLELSPFRKITIKGEDRRMYYFSEKFEFAATHTLWNDEFSEEENFNAFGKCANPAGHGHNYIVEIAAANEDGVSFSGGKFEDIVKREFVNLVDHKNLNVDVSRFGECNPTVENIAAFAWEQLNGKFDSAKLDCVTVWENDRTCCSYRGE